MENGVYVSLIKFLLNIGIFHDQAFRIGGETPHMEIIGMAMFTCIIWIASCQIPLAIVILHGTTPFFWGKYWNLAHSAVHIYNYVSHHLNKCIPNLN